MKWKIGLFIVMLACSAVQAEVYEWTDVKGVVNFTDDLNNVPSRYRDHVKKVKSVTPGEGVTPSAPHSPPAAASPVRQPAQVFGGHNEQWWRTRFDSARREVTVAREQLAAKKDSLTELHRKRVVFQKPSDRVAYNTLSEEISRDEDNLKSIEDGLAKLEQDAEKLGVPAEWRK